MGSGSRTEAVSASQPLAGNRVERRAPPSSWVRGVYLTERPTVNGSPPYANGLHVSTEPGQRHAIHPSSPHALPERARNSTPSVMTSM
jgi:hypothetical protein